MPESPVWLRENGKVEESNKVLARIHGTENIEDIVQSDSSLKDDIDTPTSLDETPTKNLLCFEMKIYRRQAIIALFLAVAQQFCGQANVLNFAPEIFKEAGLKGNSSLLSTLLLGILKFVVTVLIIFRIDYIGRRTLLLFGISLILVSLSILTIAFADTNAETGEVKSPILAIIGALGVVSGYGSSFGPLTWLVTSELFPTHIRGRALGISTIITYICAMLVSYTFLSGQELFGSSWGPFVMYMVVTFLSLIFAALAIPDTGEKNVDEVNTELNNMWIWRTNSMRTENTTESMNIPDNNRTIV